MTLVRKSWRLSDFGTVVLPDSARLSGYLVMRVSIDAVRSSLSQSFFRRPPQSIYGYVTLRDAEDFVAGQELTIRFAKNRFVLWSYDLIQTNESLCVIGNTLYAELMNELAKKPNIPPIPPSVPPIIQSPFSLQARLMLLGVSAITVKTVHRSDFTVELMWDEMDGSPCSPIPMDTPPGTAPLEDALPVPGGDNSPAPPPYNDPPILPPSAPPLGGTALIPPGYASGDQSRPPNVPTRLRLNFAATNAVNGVTCQNNISFNAVVEIDWVGPTPAAGDFSLVMQQTGSSCGFPFGPMRLFYQGALFQPVAQVGPLGVSVNSWPCTSVQPI